jgi:hypothetical protein
MSGFGNLEKVVGGRGINERRTSRSPALLINAGYKAYKLIGNKMYYL